MMIVIILRFLDRTGFDEVLSLNNNFQACTFVDTFMVLSLCDKECLDNY